MVRDPHPPKKKHSNKPRPEPVVPLTPSERAVKAQEEFEKAVTHLIEAERMADWGRAPNACVHSAYYAMHHAAAAAILASGGVGKHLDVPKSHEHVIQHYGTIVAKENESLAATGPMLNRARTDRMVADYDLVRGADAHDATETTVNARTMVDLIMARWDFYDNVTHELDDD
jgi:uncharacterized protein (UPF0332 family)